MTVMFSFVGVILANVWVAAAQCAKSPEHSVFCAFVGLGWLVAAIVGLILS